MSSTQKRIHVTSQTYLRGWSVDGARTILVDPSDGTHTHRRIETVGYRNHWWGDNPQLTAAIEKNLSTIENEVTPVLRRPLDHWPITNQARMSVSLMIGIHYARSPEFRGWVQGTAYTTIANHTLKKPHHAKYIPQFATALLQGTEVAKDILRQVTRVASIAASPSQRRLRTAGSSATRNGSRRR